MLTKTNVENLFVVTFAILVSINIVQAQIPNQQKLLDAGWDHYLKREYALAKEMNDSAIQISLLSGDLTSTAQGLINRGILFHRLQKYDSAIESYLNAFKLYTSLRDSMQIIHSLRNVALTYSRLSRFQQSIDYCNKALSFAKGKKYNEVNSWILNSLANNYESVGNFQKAKMALIEALRIVSDSSRKASMLNNLGSIQMQSGVLDSSIYYFRQSLAIREKQGDSIKYALVLNNLGETYIRSDSFHLAEECLTKSMVIRAHVDKKALVSNYNNLASLFLHTRQLEKVRNFLVLIEDQLRKDVNEREHYKFLSVRKEYLVNMGHYSQALQTDQKLDSLNRKIFEEERLKVNELQSAYEISERDQRLKLQEQELKLHLASIQQKTFVNQLVSAGVILLLLVAAALFYLYRVNSRLRYRNESLVHEQNHRVKNNLQMIASLLSVQSSSHTDETVKKILSQNENRIQSIALLHRMLYNAEISSSVPLRQYLGDLTDELKHALGAVGASFKVDTDIEQLSIENTISLGLILNELITNSVKYATYSETLQVSISLLRNENQGHLEYQDNGKSFDTESFHKTGTFGARLISIQSKQLKGKFNISNANGFNFMLTFPIS